MANLLAMCTECTRNIANYCFKPVVWRLLGVSLFGNFYLVIKNMVEAKIWVLIVGCIYIELHIPLVKWCFKYGVGMTVLVHRVALFVCNSQ